MCIFVVVLVCVSVIACWIIRKRIKELKAELHKTPARDANGRFTKRKK